MSNNQHKRTESLKIPARPSSTAVSYAQRLPVLELSGSCSPISLKPCRSYENIKGIPELELVSEVPSLFPLSGENILCPFPRKGSVVVENSLEDDVADQLEQISLAKLK